MDKEPCEFNSFPMTGPKPSIKKQREAEFRLDREHAAGIDFAKRHFTPFLQRIQNRYQFSRIQLASALIVMAYNILRKDKPAEAARRMFNVLAHKSIAHIDKQEPDRKLH